MSTQTPAQEWKYAIGGHIRITERAFVFDYAGRHASLLLSDITGVERKGIWAKELRISHRGGVLKIASVPNKAAEEIVAALGF